MWNIFDKLSSNTKVGKPNLSMSSCFLSIATGVFVLLMGIFSVNQHIYIIIKQNLTDMTSKEKDFKLFIWYEGSEGLKFFRDTDSLPCCSPSWSCFICGS